jgi:hypothetical protein
MAREWYKFYQQVFSFPSNSCLIVLVDQPPQLVFVGSKKLCHLVTILQENECWHTRDVVLQDQVFAIIHIHSEENYLREFLNHFLFGNKQIPVIQVTKLSHKQQTSIIRAINLEGPHQVA